MIERKLMTFQAWKAALILCLLTISLSAVELTMHLLDMMGQDRNGGQAALSKEISLNIMTTLGSLCISLPSIILATYLAKLLLWLMKGITVTFSEDIHPE